MLPGMRQFRKIALVWGMGWAAAATAGASAEQTLIDRIEMLDWSDPEQAEKIIDPVPATVVSSESEVQMLEVRAMVYVDVRRDSDVDATIARLQGTAQRGDKSAILAEHYVRAYSLYQGGKYAAASAELSRIDMDSIATDADRYRVAISRGNTSR